MMKKTLTSKYAAVSGIAIALWISAGIVRSVGQERKERQASVITEISSVLTTEQEIGVPYVFFPYVQISYDKKGKEDGRNSGETDFYAASAKFSGEGVVSERKRGIFRAQAYDLSLNGDANFDLTNFDENLPKDLSPKVSGKKIEFQNPYIFLPISQRKALQAKPEVRVDGVKEPLPGRTCKGGFCFDLAMSLEAARTKLKVVHVTMKVSGLEQFKFSSSAVTTSFDLKSNWPSPSFGGDVLPSTREISKKGFTAAWSSFRNSGETATYQVRFVDPIDIYTLTDRAAKHAILFIASVFLGFFAVEIFRRVRLHAIQYGLVGASLVVFYLIVLSLSEHLPFVAAYATSVVVSVSLIRFYLSGFLKNRLDANLFTGALVGLYGLLYVILSAEDFALLLGTILVFGLLGTVMILTRKMDWSSIEMDFAQKGGETTTAPDRR